MNISGLTKNIMLREICVKNEFIDKFICNYSDDNNDLKLLSLFSIKYMYADSFGFLNLPKKLSIVNLAFDYSSIKSESLLYLVNTSTYNEQVYIGNRSNLVFIGTSSSNNELYAFYLLSSDLIFLIHKQCLNSFLQEIVTPLNFTLCDNDFKNLKKELESIPDIDKCIFYSIDKK
jgi:hypothetical protein